MTSSRTGQTVSGAAQGAATGAMIGGVPGAVIGGVIGGIGGLISGGAADDSFANQMAWSNYNRQSQYNTDLYNINSSLMVAGMNAALSTRAARYNASNVLAAATYNAEIISATTVYNEELLDNELLRIWQDLDLDVYQIEMFRARERGNMVADQSASGTVIGDGSNAMVVRDQMTQEAMDISIVEFGADRQAANVNNQIAQGRWQGEVAIQQTMWEGQVQANSIMFNAKNQAAGTVMSAVIQADANMYSAKQAYMTAGYNQQQASYQFGQQNTQDMIGGLFSAAGTVAVGHYANKVPVSKTYTGPLSPSSQYNTPKALLRRNTPAVTSPSPFNTTLGNANTTTLLTSGLGS